MVQINFKQKVVVITGGTRGLGKAMVKAFSRAGAKVIYTGTALNGKPLPGTIYWPLDLADEHSLNEFIERLRALKRLDVLINNAGINAIEPIDRLSRSNWDKIVQVNLTGAMVLMREAAGLMKKRRIPGRILNVSSIFGLISKAHRNAYSATKAGLIGLTRSSALDLASQGILVNAICPGFVLTDLTKRILSVSEQQRLKSQVPLGRFGREDEIAAAALFLCSDLNSYITGQAIIADGGFSIQ